MLDARKIVNEACDQDADQAHDQERAELREISLGRVTVEAGGAEHRGRDEEGARDAGWFL